jgi:acyl-CoA dehydrogenase
LLRDQSVVINEGAGIDRVVPIAAAHADAVDRDGRFPDEAVTALREEGLLGAMVPVSLGGQGATLATVAGYCQRLGGACASTAMVFAMHQIQVACVLAHGLDQPWYAALAREIAADQMLLASITSEVGIGGDMRSSLCAVEVADSDFALTKRASTVSYGAHADLFLVTARRHGEAPPSDQVLLAVRRGQCTLTATGGWDALGMRGTCSMAFDLTASGHADQIMAAPFADVAAETMTPVSHLLWGAVWTGIAVAAVSKAREFLRVQARRQPGVPLPGAARLMQASGSLEMMQARLATLIRAYDASHALGSDRRVVADEVAGWPGGLARATALNMVKHDVSEMCHQAVLQAMLVCGMAGYRNDTAYSMGRHLRDVLSAQVMINNDRIAANTGALLLAQRAELGTL